MKTELLMINRNPVWVTFRKSNIDNTENQTEINEQVVCYIKLSKPEGEDYGKLLTNKKNEAVCYPSISQARDKICYILKAKIYPPDFLHPLEYTIEDVDEIMNKLLNIGIGDVYSEETDYSVKGIIYNCSFAGNPPFLPVAAQVRLDNKTEKTFNFFEMKKIWKTNCS